jgi:hypothetical protein
LAGIKCAWVIHGHYKFFFAKCKGMLLTSGKSLVLDKDKIIEFIRTFHPREPKFPNTKNDMTLSNLSFLLKNGYSARKYRRDHYYFLRPDELDKDTFDRACSDFYNEIDQEIVKYAGDCIDHAMNPLAGLPKDMSGTPLEFFARLIVGGYTREKFIVQIPQYLNAMGKSKAFGAIMSELLKRGI